MVAVVVVVVVVVVVDVVDGDGDGDVSVAQCKGGMRQNSRVGNFRNPVEFNV
jgi:hypothetical protein